MKFCAPRLVLAGLLVIATGAMFAACDDDDDDPTGPDDGPFTGTIHILDNRYSPSSVTISVGDSVTWSWDGNNSHSVTHGTSPTNPPDASKLFDSPIQSSGTFGYRFNNAGTFVYFCRPHFPAMTGSVIVQP
jgi:plastocyanin